MEAGFVNRKHSKFPCGPSRPPSRPSEPPLGRYPRSPNLSHPAHIRCSKSGGSRRCPREDRRACDARRESGADRSRADEIRPPNRQPTVSSSLRRINLFTPGEGSTCRGTIEPAAADYRRQTASSTAAETGRAQDAPTEYRQTGMRGQNARLRRAQAAARTSPGTLPTIS